MKPVYYLSLAFASFLFACSGSPDKEYKTQSVPANRSDSSAAFDATRRGISNDTGFNSLSVTPNLVILTGIENVRLFSVYKLREGQDRNIFFDEGGSYRDEEEFIAERDGNFQYFMPGIDIIHGYNLVNIGHYQLDKDSLSYFFDKPVLVKTLYFPGAKPDSLNGKPVKRNYFLVSVYNEDTNKDSLISNKDLRRIIHFDGISLKSTDLLPAGYSSIRSTYDYKKDIMYIYARNDENRNGYPDPEEQISIFWFYLDNPIGIKKIL